MTDWQLVLLVILAPTAFYVVIEEWNERRRRARDRVLDEAIARRYRRGGRGV